MKKLIVIVCTTLITTMSFSQGKGSLLLTCKDKESLSPIENVNLEVYQDSSCWEDYSDQSGKVWFKDLKNGPAKIRFVLNEGYSEEHEVVIQEKQLFQYTVLIDSSKLNSINLDPKEYELSNNGAKESKQKIEKAPEIREIFNSETKELEEVRVVAYKAPLINRDGGASGQTITREDIMKLPVRSAHGIAATVGGVNTFEDSEEFSVRGSRTDANYYFIDGVKIIGAPNVPKSYINEVKVYNGSIPANYGDVTGGVISIESKPIRMNKVNRPRKSNNNYSNDWEQEHEQFNYDNFLPIYENDFLSPLLHPHATFGLDVDQAAWGYLKNVVKENRTIQRDAVKLEEMINAFKHTEVRVPEDELMHVVVDRSECSWSDAHELVTVHLKAKDLPKDLPRKPHNFVFLVDVSGSMFPNDRLPLLIKGLKTFVKTLQPNDRIAIVTYAGRSGVVLPTTTCENKDKILEALSDLQAGGSTNGIGGIKEAYRQAELNFDSTYNNRIILATDGDFNVGINSVGDLENYISSKRGQGIYLTALGVGMGNYKNSTLETLAKRGDGNHFYIRNLRDCKEVLIDNIGNLINIARDVKLNVEFNPRMVSNYRLIGYENRLLKPKDFDDDTKDAGEIGYGHQVTAVFQIEKGKAETVESHFTKQKSSFGKSELAHVKLRYKPMEEEKSIKRVFSLAADADKKENELLNIIIALGLELRDSAFKGSVSPMFLQEKARNFHAKTEQEIALKNMILTLFSSGI